MRHVCSACQLFLGIFVPDISSRLREGREALGLSQQALAEKCGISARSQRNYESGERSPDADYLAAIAAAGFDVLYLLTGHRSAFHAALGHLRTASEMAQKLGGSDAEMARAAEALFNQLNRSALAPDEQMLLDCYREWSPEVKKRELRRAMGVSPSGMQDAEPAAQPQTHVGGSHSQHNSGDNAVQIGSHGGKVTIKKGR